MKFSFIAKHRGIWALDWMCGALGVSRGGFYAGLTRPRSQRSRDNEPLAAKVRSSFLASDRTYGARRVWRDLLAEGISCGLHRIERLMRLQALKARPRRRRLPPDLGERQVGAVAPNVLDRSFEAAAPNRKWIADFTYVWTAEGWLYVAAVVDLFSRRVVGWSMSAAMTAQLVTDALVMAIWRRGKPDALLQGLELDKPIEFAQRNIESKKILDEGKAAAAIGEWDRAIEKAKAVDENSEQYDDARELVKAWVKGREQALVDVVRKAADDGDFDAARAAIEKVPLELQEGLKHEVAEKERQRKLDEEKHKNDEKAQAANARLAREEKQRQMVAEAVAPAVHKIELGDFEGVGRQCERIAETNSDPAVIAQLKRIKRKAEPFGQAYTAGMSSFNSGAMEQAATSLYRAFQLFEDMDITAPKFEATLRKNLAQALAVKGRATSSRQDYGAAARAFNEALKFNPECRDCREGIAEIRRHAQRRLPAGLHAPGARSAGGAAALPGRDRHDAVQRRAA